MHMPKLLRKLIILVFLVAGLAYATADYGAESAAAPMCDPSVYEFCWGQGRNVGEDCQCNYQSCLGIPDSTCTEVGGSLDYATCTCQPGDLLPWCPPNRYEQCFNSGLSLNSLSCNCYTSDVPGGGTDMPLCTYNSFSWCQTSSGAWDDWNCNCFFKDTSNNCTAGASVRLSCENNGGTWNVSECRCDY